VSPSLPKTDLASIKRAMENEGTFGVPSTLDTLSVDCLLRDLRGYQNGRDNDNAEPYELAGPLGFSIHHFSRVLALNGFESEHLALSEEVIDRLLDIACTALAQIQTARSLRFDSADIKDVDRQFFTSLRDIVADYEWSNA
jgi:hypothetical protein